MVFAPPRFVVVWDAGDRLAQTVRRGESIGMQKEEAPASAAVGPGRRSSEKGLASRVSALENHIR
jgi:hypothetical protein